MRYLGEIRWLCIESNHKMRDMMHHIDTQVSSDLQVSMVQQLCSHLLLEGQYEKVDHIGGRESFFEVLAACFNYVI